MTLLPEALSTAEHAPDHCVILQRPMELAELKPGLDSLVLRCFSQTLETIGAPRSDHAELSRHYLEAVERLGFA